MPEVKTSEDGDSSITIMSTGDDSQERTEYLSKVNTELMSGEGADILAMDILPYCKYAAGGQLEDLQAYMDADETFHMEDYQKECHRCPEISRGSIYFTHGLFLRLSCL